MDKKQYLIIILALVLLAGVIAYWNARKDEISNKVGEQIPAESEQSSQNIVTSADNAPPGSIHNLLVPAGVAAARQALAVRLSIDPKNILILTAFEKDWPNSCLGLEGEGEFCAQVITPGFEVKMKAQGQVYIYRTNIDGTVVKAED